MKFTKTYTNLFLKHMQISVFFFKRKIKHEMALWNTLMSRDDRPIGTSWIIKSSKLTNFAHDSFDKLGLATICYNIFALVSWDDAGDMHR